MSSRRQQRLRNLKPMSATLRKRVAAKRSSIHRRSKDYFPGLNSHDIHDKIRRGSREHLESVLKDLPRHQLQHCAAHGHLHFHGKKGSKGGAFYARKSLDPNSKLAKINRKVSELLKAERSQEYKLAWDHARTAPNPKGLPQAMLARQYLTSLVAERMRRTGTTRPEHVPRRPTFHRSGSRSRTHSKSKSPNKSAGRGPMTRARAKQAA